MSEMDLVNAVIQYLTMVGAVAIRINSGMTPIDDPATGRRRVVRGAPAGTADVLCCWRGRFLAVECKIGKNKPTPAQEAFLLQVKAAGGQALVVWSIDDLVAGLGA